MPISKYSFFDSDRLQNPCWGNQLQFSAAFGEGISTTAAAHYPTRRQCDGGPRVVDVNQITRELPRSMRATAILQELDQGLYEQRRKAGSRSSRKLLQLK